MIDLINIKGFYLIGIGGIGMSALASFFISEGYSVSGYDRSKTTITDSLSAAGCIISFEDDPVTIPAFFKDPMNHDRTGIIYTPAVPSESRILSYFKNQGYTIYKRSEILGELSKKTETIAVAGTHGKTTVSTMITHLLKESHLDCSAFLGGISKNYGSNFIKGKGIYTVMEADEFDRSFHRLSPAIAVVTSADADHLDIYGDHSTMIAAYDEFCNKIRKGGSLFISSRIKDVISPPSDITTYTYGTEGSCDYMTTRIAHNSEGYRFDLKTPYGVLKDFCFTFPGIVNIENMTVAAAVALKCGARETEIRMAMLKFMGVTRRFDIRIDEPGIAYLDDYAHHPAEIKALIMSVKEYFRGRKITGIFQPHLYSRTKDHADGFAAILDELDEVILLPIYPAREKPVPGVSSDMIYKRMKNSRKHVMMPEEITAWLERNPVDVLVTIGAGDIDKLVGPIEKILMKEVKG